MGLCKWEKLPAYMRTPEVKAYYDILERKKLTLIGKRIGDIILAAVMLIILSPLFLILAVAIKIDSRGTVMFRQTRITQYGKKFRIFKFRTMISEAEKVGTQVTTKNDARITRVGSLIRKCRLDEIPQLLNIIAGDMTFVGTRPEVEKYVNAYTPEMYATLLLPAGVTSMASIQYKDEDTLLENADNVDETYIEKVLPQKMKYNLEALKHCSVITDIGTMLQTVIAVLR